MASFQRVARLATALLEFIGDEALTEHTGACVMQTCMLLKSP